MLLRAGRGVRHVIEDFAGRAADARIEQLLATQYRDRAGNLLRRFLALLRRHRYRLQGGAFAPAVRVGRGNGIGGRRFGMGHAGSEHQAADGEGRAQRAAHRRQMKGERRNGDGGSRTAHG
ncbi:hypothetical protein D3C72_1684720 [compost metagenome]